MTPVEGDDVEIGGHGFARSGAADRRVAGRGVRADRRRAYGGAGGPERVDRLAVLPRFDSGACFAALLGNEEHGFWRIAPAASADRAVRRYRGGRRAICVLPLSRPLDDPASSSLNSDGPQQI
jgi:hypothetical protein